MANKAYDGLAAWFEYLNDDCGLEEWAEHVIALLRQNGAGKNGLDIGCGSGYFTRQLHKAGYAVSGADVSEAMIEKAQTLTKAQGLNVLYVLQDVTTLKGFKKLDFVTAINDCFNYVPKEKLVTAFKKVATSLKKGGLFSFDVSSKKKLENLPPVSIDDREDVTYISFYEQKKESVTMDVSLFVKDVKDGRYERLDEKHVQYIYAEEEILSALEQAGFACLIAQGHMGADKTQADRIEFLARRM